MGKGGGTGEWGCSFFGIYLVIFLECGSFEAINNFENLLIWKEGMQLATNVYVLLKNCKDFGLKDQMQRAVVSVPSNIAEGYERDSEKEFLRFLITS